MASTPVQQTPETPLPETFEKRVQKLMATWKEVCPSHPRDPVLYDHPVYREIVGLGPAVVPHLLRALREYPRDWFWALHIITGADPVAPEERGNFTAMREAWLLWGREHGYLPEDRGGANGNNDRPTPASPPGPRHAVELEEKFQRLAAIWQAETCYLSSTKAIVNHPAYQEIIGLGPAVIPLVFRELERKPAQWFTALRALTGADPMEPAHRGKIGKIAEAWLRWGRANGFQW